MRWLRWHCPPDSGFEIRALAVWGRARYLSVTEVPHNTDFHTWMGKKHFCFFQTAETGNRTPNSGVKGSGANHYPRAPARNKLVYSKIQKKVKVQVYSLISSLKTYHPTLHLTPWSLDLFIREPFQLHGEHTVLQPFRRIELIVHIAISVLPGTHFHLSQVKHLRVKCLAQGHNILTMSQDWEGRNMIFLWKLCTSGIRNRTAGSDIGRALRSNHCAMSLSK